ncbi:sulfur carrier protein ThiS [Motilibacter aurantiacus]|uniref:sulfur carrier protein ThiS n=1 Tax=Motilibacter aurantiacus TaxID=2714955 RepID=UPI00140735DF|nr:sulfur carrier protein ThiS [Motilibacter aurantiacus]
MNGKQASVDEAATVAQVVRRSAPEARRVAVAVNGEVVARGAWQTTVLAAGDAVEVLAPVAGG